MLHSQESNRTFRLQNAVYKLQSIESSAYISVGTLWKSEHAYLLCLHKCINELQKKFQ